MPYVSDWNECEIVHTSSPKDKNFLKAAACRLPGWEAGPAVAKATKANKTLKHTFIFFNFLRIQGMI